METTKYLLIILSISISILKNVSITYINKYANVTVSASFCVLLLYIVCILCSK